MDLGTFSVSLAVKDLSVSMQFYEKLGFRQIAGNAADNWVILKNGEAAIGLFQDMFEENILTFNPERGTRDYYRALKADSSVNFVMESDAVLDRDTGPCHFCITDPDGNQILFDQHTEH